MVEVKIVKSKKDKKNFINFENKLYSECEYFIPTIYKEEMKLFSHKKNPNLISNETSAYLAYQDGKIVGRVMCAFNRIEKDKKNIIRFSHLDFINDTEVSFALFDMIENWAKFLKSDKIIGDISFNDLENIGVLYSGYDKFATFQHRYNYPYYSNHLKDYGYTTSKKLHEYQLELNNDIDISTLNYDDTKYKIVEGTKEFKIKNYDRKIFDLLYANSVSGYPIVIEDGVYEKFFNSLNRLFNSEDLIILVNDNDDVVGAMLLTYNTSLALQTTEGKELSSKNNYNVDIENHKYIDLSLYVVDCNDKENISMILNNILIKSMKIKNNQFVNTNLWIQDLSIIIHNDYFKKVWSRERVIYSKNLKTLNVRKPKEELVEVKNLANNDVVY